MFEIRAGRLEEAVWTSGEWAFVDVGFAQKSRSCAIVVGLNTPEELTFGDLGKELVRLASDCTAPLNLVIEAPLSVAFGKAGNPIGRTIELRNGKARYWYVGLGCCVLVAATYLVRMLTDAKRTREIRLFEGLVSFKEKGVRSSHSADVLQLRDVIRGQARIGRTVGSDELASADHQLVSAFRVAGMDYGVPPVIAVGA